MEFPKRTLKYKMVYAEQSSVASQKHALRSSEMISAATVLHLQSHVLFVVFFFIFAVICAFGNLCWMLDRRVCFNGIYYLVIG